MEVRPGPYRGQCFSTNHRGFTHEVLTHCAPRSGWSCCLVAHGSHGHGSTQRKSRRRHVQAIGPQRKSGRWHVQEDGPQRKSRRRHVQEVEEEKEVIKAQVGFTGTSLRPEATAPGFLCLPLSTRRERGPYCRAAPRTGGARAAACSLMGGTPRRAHN